MARCPECKSVGRKVTRLTLESLLRPERRADVGDGQYHVCVTPDCETVYFGSGDDGRFVKSDLVVRFGLKETSPPRPVCYCFGYTMEDIEEEIHRTGSQTVVERIKAAMKESGCRCEYTNPLGTCCLKSVQDAVTHAFSVVGSKRSCLTVEPDAGTDAQMNCCSGGTASSAIPAATLETCCAVEHETSDSGTTPNPDEPRAGQAASSTSARAEFHIPNYSHRARIGFAAAGGSVLAAMLSSACCWVPLLLVAFGVSAAGVAGFLEVYRPYYIAGAVVLLGTGFYTVYFRRGQCAPDSACRVPSHKLRVFNQIMLWTATALVGSFVFFPNYVGYLLAAGTAESTAADDVGLVAVKFHVEGMTCEGCAAGLRSKLVKLPNVVSAEVDFATETAVVRYGAGTATEHERVIEAAKAAGFTTTLADVP